MPSARDRERNKSYVSPTCLQQPVLERLVRLGPISDTACVRSANSEIYLSSRPTDRADFGLLRLED